MFYISSNFFLSKHAQIMFRTLRERNLSSFISTSSLYPPKSSQFHQMSAGDLVHDSSTKRPNRGGFSASVVLSNPCSPRRPGATRRRPWRGAGHWRSFVPTEMCSANFWQTGIYMGFDETTLPTRRRRSCTRQFWWGSSALANLPGATIPGPCTRVCLFARSLPRHCSARQFSPRRSRIFLSARLRLAKCCRA